MAGWVAQAPPMERMDAMKCIKGGHRNEKKKKNGVLKRGSRTTMFKEKDPPGPVIE